MKLNDIVDVITRDVSGAKNSSANRHDPAYLKQTIHSYRARLAERDYKSTGFINPIYLQNFYLQFDKTFQATIPQGNKFILYKLPRTITMVKKDGIEYIGGISCSSPWRYLKSRSEMATLNSNWFTAISNHQKEIYALYDAGNSRLEIYNGQTVQEGLVMALFADPTEVNTYNVDVDQYPIAEDSISELREMIYMDITDKTKSTKPEETFNTPENIVSFPPRPVTPKQPTQ